MKRTMSYPLRYWLISIWAMGLGGCAFNRPAIVPAARNPPYDWGFYNASRQNLREVHMTYPYGKGRATATAGILDAGGSKINGSGFDPIPPLGTVTWQTPDGQNHQQDVAISGKVPDLERFSGIIWFVYTGDGWVLKTMTYETAWKRAATGRYRHPDVPDTGPEDPPPFSPEGIFDDTK
jgi:hypothetical protein